MSAENVELVRRSVELFNEGGVDAMLDTIDPELEAHSYEGWPGDPVYHGRDGWRALVNEWVENFDDYEWRAREFHDAGDAVVVVAEHSGRMKGSGAKVRADVSMVVSAFRDGRLKEVRFFHTGDEAKRYAGIA